MIAVTDTSPICYLILIREVELLPKLFSQVLAPQAVIAELLHDDAPETVRAWVSNLPWWIAVRESPASTITGMEKLQAGEQEAILLAQAIRAEMVLIDEKSAWQLRPDLPGSRASMLPGSVAAGPAEAKPSKGFSATPPLPTPHLRPASPWAGVSQKDTRSDSREWRRERTRPKVGGQETPSPGWRATCDTSISDGVDCLVNYLVDSRDQRGLHSINHRELQAQRA